MHGMDYKRLLPDKSNKGNELVLRIGVICA